MSTAIQNTLLAQIPSTQKQTSEQKEKFESDLRFSIMEAGTSVRDGEKTAPQAARELKQKYDSATIKRAIKAEIADDEGAIKNAYSNYKAHKDHPFPMQVLDHSPQGSHTEYHEPPLPSLVRFNLRGHIEADKALLRYFK